MLFHTLIQVQEAADEEPQNGGQESQKEQYFSEDGELSTT